MLQNNGIDCLNKINHIYPKNKGKVLSVHLGQTLAAVISVKLSVLLARSSVRALSNLSASICSPAYIQVTIQIEGESMRKRKSIPE